MWAEEEVAMAVTAVAAQSNIQSCSHSSTQSRSLPTCVCLRASLTLCDEVEAFAEFVKKVQEVWSGSNTKSNSQAKAPPDWRKRFECFFCLFFFI